MPSNNVRLARAAAGTLALIVGSAAVAGVAAASAVDSTGWTYFAGSKRIDRYSPLSQINRDTVSHLQVLWTRPGVDSSLTHEFPDLSPSNYLPGTPIFVDGILYGPNGGGLVEAFDPATGKTFWVQKPFAATLKEAAGQSTRGVDSWSKGTDKRIIAVRGEFLYSLDAKTGAALET